MNSKIKTIIISVVVVAVLVMVYIFFVKDRIKNVSLTTTFGINQNTSEENTSSVSAELDVDFLALLLSVKSIKLNDTIFSNSAFFSLRDSSITLQGDGTEGRNNPFAPIGSDINNVRNNNLTTP